MTIAVRAVQQLIDFTLAVMEIKCIVARLVRECNIIYIDEARIDPTPSYFKYANVFGQFAPLPT